jgi:hypothetical protein
MLHRDRVNGNTPGKKYLLFFMPKKLFSNFLILSLIVQASIGLFAFPQITHAAGTTYYVDCNAANDLGAGTSAGTAWKTIAKVIPL